MFRVLFGVVLAVLVSAAHAESPVEVLSKCVVENTTGRDRKDLAKWVFLAMSAHPQMRALVTVPAAVAEEASRSSGRLFTKLVAEVCAKDARAAVQTVGPAAIQSAFTVLGEIAMQELMADKDVQAYTANTDKYIDAEKFQWVLGGK